MVTRETILKKALEMASHNLYCTSENYLCSRPRHGQEAQHAEYSAEVEFCSKHGSQNWRTETNNGNTTEAVPRGAYASC